MTAYFNSQEFTSQNSYRYFTDILKSNIFFLEWNVFLAQVIRNLSDEQHENIILKVQGKHVFPFFCVCVLPSGSLVS